MKIEQLENLLCTMYKGVYASRQKIRETLEKLSSGLTDHPLTNNQVEEYVDRVRLYQEEYRRRKEAGYIGVGLIFPLPTGPTPGEGEAWLEEDRKTANV